MKCDSCGGEFEHLVSLTDHPNYHDGMYCEACLKEMCPPPPQVPLTVGPYTISSHDCGDVSTIWVEKMGEGMALDLDKLWKGF